jgi:hypothetical protein
MVRVTKTPMTPEDRFAEGVILTAQKSARSGNTPLRADHTSPSSRRPGLGRIDTYLAGRVSQMWQIIRYGR